MTVRAATYQEIAALCRVTGLVPTPHAKGVTQNIENLTHGIVVYDRWTANSVEMHVWIPRSITKGFIRACFDYPFIQAGKGLVLGVTPSNNTAALAMNKKLGFRVVHVIKDGNAVGEDLVLQEMRKEECKWLSTLN